LRQGPSAWTTRTSSHLWAFWGNNVVELASFSAVYLFSVVISTHQTLRTHLQTIPHSSTRGQRRIVNFSTCNTGFRNESKMSSWPYLVFRQSKIFHLGLISLKMVYKASLTKRKQWATGKAPGSFMQDVSIVFIDALFYTKVAFQGLATKL
jgi:hypothetical protein